MRFVLLVPAAFAAVVALIACSSDPAPAAAPPPTYEADVFPIFVKNCALTACHGSKEAPQGVHFSPTDKDETYTSLMKESMVFIGTKLVVAGEPENSLVIRKMDGTQAELKSCTGSCGKSMPPPEDDNDPTSAKLLSQKKRDTVRAWIKAGAENN